MKCLFNKGYYILDIKLQDIDSLIDRLLKCSVYNNKIDKKFQVSQI